MPQNEAIRVENLVKDFGPLRAVDGVSFRVREGEIFSLLGPNGAGKSTTISIIAGLLRATSGEASVFGRSIAREPQAVKAAIGVVPQEVALYPDLSAQENLVFWGRMYGLGGRRLAERVREVLELIGLADRRRDRIGAFSGGMKRRVNLGVALLHEPRLLILDEPTVGIDPQSRRHILDSVLGLNARGMSVLYTTHYMEEAQELSTRLCILDRGRLIAEGTHAELVRLVGELDRIELTLQGELSGVPEAWRRLPGVRAAHAEEGRISLLADDGERLLPRLFEEAARERLRIASVQIREPNLEAVFMKLTGRALRDT
jgi:ABC-2 type transport system ATP-binding protein